MTRVRDALYMLWSAMPDLPGMVRGIFEPPILWWRGLEPADTLLYLGCALLAAGMLFVWPPGALIVPGAVLAATAGGFRFDGSPLTSMVTGGMLLGLAAIAIWKVAG